MIIIITGVKKSRCAGTAVITLSGITLPLLCFFSLLGSIDSMGNQEIGRKYDCIILGTGPAGLGAAFELAEKGLALLLIDKESYSTGGLRNDCKMNFTYPIGFSQELWDRATAEHYLERVKERIHPVFMDNTNIDIYKNRASKLDVELLEVQQTHLGTDGGLNLIKRLKAELEELGVDFVLGETVIGLKHAERKKDLFSSTPSGGGMEAPFFTVVTEKREFYGKKVLLAPGRKGFRFLQGVMDDFEIPYVDHMVDIGIRVEARIENFPIVKDYYDPKFLFPAKVRTFCANSGSAFVVKEKYHAPHGKEYWSVNGHAYSHLRSPNGLVNFALLKTVAFTEPLASGQDFAEMLGLQAMLMGGDRPIMQRVGDFRLGKRSKRETFTGDLYDFSPTLADCTPGDISLATPAKILRAIWRSLKYLDTIVPGILHPSTIMYYPEIKLYANKPRFIDDYFQAFPGLYLAGDGAGTSRGITAAWASGIRAARGIAGK